MKLSIKLLIITFIFLGFHSSLEAQNVTFRVDMSTTNNFSSETNTVSLRGNFNGWGETPMTNVGDDIYSVTVSFPAGGVNAGDVALFKFFHSGGGGTWESNVFSGAGEDRRFTVPENDVTLLAVIWNNMYPDDNPLPQPSDEIDGAPVLTAPLNEATNISSLASFTWDEVENATFYRIQISTSADFSSLHLTAISSETTYTVASGSGLRGGTTYYWRVRGENSEFLGDYSSSFSFETVPNFTVYYNNPNEWENVYAYAFTPGHYVQWPGEQMTSGNGWFSYDVPSTYSNVIFNNGSGGEGNQTADLSRNTTGWYDGFEGKQVWYAAEPNQITGNAGWRMLSLPADGVAIRTLAGQNLVQGVSGANAFYDDGIEYEDGVSSNFLLFDGITSGTYVAPADFDTELSSGTGFIWYMYNNTIANSVELPFFLFIEGDSQNRETVSVDLGTAQADNWNLIGNPYSHALNVDQSANVLSGAAVGGSLASTIPQVWDPALGTWTQPNALSVFQGFFVQNETATSLSFSPSMLNDSEVTLLDAPSFAKIGFQLEAGEHLDKAAVLYFHEAATDGWDIYDVSKLTPLRDSWVTLGFVGERQGETTLKAYESRPLFFNESFTVAVEINAQNFQGDAVLSWPKFEDVPQNWSIILEDTQTNTKVDLRSHESYSFSVSGGMAPNAILHDRKPEIATLASSGAAPRFLVHVSPSQVTSSELGTDLPAAVALSQNYPNPFNPTTVISYALPENAMVRLTVYDVLGRQVATLVNDVMPAGTHSATFDAAQLASGMYIYRLQAGTTTLTRTMTLVK